MTETLHDNENISADREESVWLNFNFHRLGQVPAAGTRVRIRPSSGRGADGMVGNTRQQRESGGFINGVTLDRYGDVRAENGRYYSLADVVAIEFEPYKDIRVTRTLDDIRVGDRIRYANGSAGNVLDGTVVAKDRLIGDDRVWIKFDSRFTDVDLRSRTWGAIRGTAGVEFADPLIDDDERIFSCYLMYQKVAVVTPRTRRRPLPANSTRFEFTPAPVQTDVHFADIPEHNLSLEELRTVFRLGRTRFMAGQDRVINIRSVDVSVHSPHAIYLTLDDGYSSRDAHVDINGKVLLTNLQTIEDATLLDIPSRRPYKNDVIRLTRSDATHTVVSSCFVNTNNNNNVYMIEVTTDTGEKIEISVPQPHDRTAAGRSGFVSVGGSLTPWYFVHAAEISSTEREDEAGIPLRLPNVGEWVRITTYDGGESFGVVSDIDGSYFQLGVGGDRANVYTTHLLVTGLTVDNLPWKFMPTTAELDDSDSLFEDIEMYQNMDINELRRKIHKYACEKMAADNNCTPGTDEFLRHIDLPDSSSDSDSLPQIKNTENACVDLLKKTRDYLKSYRPISESYIDRYLHEFGMRAYRKVSTVVLTTRIEVPYGEVWSEEKIRRAFRDAFPRPVTKVSYKQINGLPE